MSKKPKIEIPDQVGNENRGEIVLYQPEGEVRLEVRVENETVWLTANQMARLFNRDEKTLRKHINNVFSEEVEKEVLSLIICTDNRKEPFVLGSVGAGNVLGYPRKKITELDVYRLTVYRPFNIQCIVICKKRVWIV